MVEKRSERPPRLVMTCAYLALIGAFQVIQAVVILTNWYSESAEKQVKQFTDPLVEGGLNRGDAETTFRIYLAILAILGGGVAVFAIYTALGHVASRILLTITAPLMALVGWGLGSFLAVVLSVVTVSCVIQLWTADVRQWFALLSGKPLPAPVVTAPPAPSTPVGQVGPVGQPPVAHHMVGQPPAPRTTDVPKILAIVTLSISSMVALGCGIYLMMYELALDRLVQQQLDSEMNWMDLTEAEIRDSYDQLAILSWVVLPLSLVAVGVSSILLLRRRRHDGR
ncbi:hypothetical protein [Aeromicrobium sp.]|uniref:hypothetical protein n=1 Tax=Aeromicrobium sp. TaxID=1871063 RepID=UPI0030BF52E0